MNRARAIVRRWMSLICCGAVASSVWALVGDPAESLLRSLSDHLASIRSDILASAVLVAIAAGCWPLGRRRWLAFFGLRHFWTYPPLWVAIAIALLLTAVYAGVTSGWDPVLARIQLAWWSITEVPLGLWIATAAAAALALVVTEFPSRRARESRREATDLPALIDWLRDDREISHPDDDRFQHNAVALRIVGRLTGSKGESPTMAVVGPLGSGKSTIRRLVEHHLTAHRSVRMLHLSLWPFDSAEAAVAGILRAVIRALGKHVNTLAVTGLSERYVTAIERVGGRWGVLARFLRGESRPEAILQGLAAIATAAGVKLVLWIEDMERFTGADRLPPEEAAIREAERLGPILSLLFLLDRCESISVIVGDTSLRSRLDVGKIARFVESPPRPTAKEVWQQIAILRSACLGEDFIDPSSYESRKVLTPPEDDTRLDMWLWSIRDTEPRIQEAIALLLSTPRSFKWALRLTWETWERLRGEIDFDSVLVASALRVSRPDLFALIDEHVDLFRHGFRDPLAGLHGNQGEHPVLGQLRAQLEREDSERLRHAVRAVIAFVFPAALREHEGEDDYVACPQGLSVDRHVHYWHRYLTLPLVGAHQSDQAALRTIAAWKEGRENDLARRVVDAQRSGQIETFVGQFSPPDLCRLLADTANALRNESARSWEDGRHAPGITSIWRMMHNRRPAVALLADTVSAVVTDVVTHHLPLAHDVYYFFAHDERSSVPSLLDDAQRDRVRAALRGALVDTFHAGSGEQLLQALHEGSPWVVWFLCSVASSGGAHYPPFDGWVGVSDALVEAAEQDPAVGVPLTIPFFVRSELVTTYRPSADTGTPQPVREYTTNVDLSRMRQLFDFDRLAPLLVETPPAEGLDPQMRALYEAAQAAVAEALQNSESSGGAPPDVETGNEVGSDAAS